MRGWTERRPFSADAKVELARLHHEFGDNVGEEEQLLAAINVDTHNARARTALGRIREEEGDYAQALAHFRHALELDPNEGEFHAFCGWTLFLVQREDPQARAAAIEQLERAQKLAPRSPTGYYYLGQLRKACGEADQAGKMFRKVLELRPEHVEASRELRLLQRRRKETSDSGPGGLFGFGRKKK